MILRLLTFLALFSVGLTLLFVISGAELPKRVARGQSLRMERTPGVVLDDASAGSAVLMPGGRLEYAKAVPTENGWSQRFELVANESVMVAGGTVELSDLEIALYNPDDGAVFGVVKAEVGRTRLEQSVDNLRPELSSEIEFEDVEVQLLSGTRLVPLTLTSERLVGDLDRGRFETDAFAEIRGSGLEAMGQGLLLDMAEGRARFTRDGECLVSGAGSLSGDSSGSGRIASTGPLEIRRVGDEIEGAIELIAEQRALLVVEGSDGLRLDAREIRVVGRSASGPLDGSDESASSLVFESLRGEGEVTLVAQGHEFSAQTATFTTTENGRLADARLEVAPRAWLRIESPDTESQRAADETVVVRGESSMTLNWEPRVGFQVAGPAYLTWRDTTLSAQGGLSGSPPTDSAAANFHAWNQVELEFDGWSIETSELDGRIDVVEEGSSEEDFTLYLEAEFETMVEGMTSTGEQVALRATRGLDFAGGNDGWIVPRARGVQLTLTSDPPLNAAADLLENFDPVRQSFVASDAVELQVGEALLRGRQLVAEGPGSIRVVGEQEALVTYSAPGVEVESIELERIGTRMTATNDVIATVSIESLSARIEADRLDLFGAALEETPELRESAPTTLIADGNVRSRIEQGEELYDLTGEHLRLERTPIIGSAAAVTDLRMVGHVDARATSRLGEFELTSRELSGRLFDGGDPDVNPDLLAEDADGQLIAVGDVWMRTNDARAIEATCERLTLLPGGRAIFTPTENGLVQVNGRLPKQERPFELKAKSVDATDVLIVAERPQITLLAAADSEETTPLDGLKASAVRLEATPERVDLLGDVSILGTTPQDDNWTLRSNSATFEGAAATDAQSALSRMTATGSVSVEYANGPRATGERLTATAWSGRIRLEGNEEREAVVLFDGFAHGADWIEFDTRDYLLSSSGGWLDNDRTANSTESPEQ